MSINEFHGVSEQSKAIGQRLLDAKVLAAAGRWRGSIYLAGYAVECALKAQLMRKFDCRTLDDLEQELGRRGILPVQKTVYTHQLISLLELTGSLPRMRRNLVLWRMFSVVNKWVPAWRYTSDPSSRTATTEFLEAVEQVVQWITNNV